MLRWSDGVSRACPEQSRRVRQYGGRARTPGSQRTNSNLTLGAQNLAQLVIDFYRFLRGLIDQFDPAAQVFGRSRLRNQVGGLHDRFERIAEIVRQHSEFPRHFRRYLIGGISHGLALPGDFYRAKLWS